jgi:hypothetical protein|tara:strand:+ start:62 stop:313 length:252 start_codon:yes stop_codon:yes gene_type:complete
MDNFSDMWKDVYGVRPCEWTMESYSFMDKAERLDWKVALQQDIDAQLQADSDAHDEALIACIKAGAGNVATAERWLRQAERNF